MHSKILISKNKPTIPQTETDENITSLADLTILTILPWDHITWDTCQHVHILRHEYTLLHQYSVLMGQTMGQSSFCFVVHCMICDRNKDASKFETVVTPHTSVLEAAP